MLLLAQLTNNCSNGQFENHPPGERGLESPIRFKPTKETVNLKNTTKLKLEGGISEMYSVLFEGNTETFILKVQEHKTLIKDLKIEENISALSAEGIIKQVRITTLNTENSAEPTAKAKLEELLSARLKIKASIKSLHKQAFNVMTTLLSSFLGKAWKVIVE